MTVVLLMSFAVQENDLLCFFLSKSSNSAGDSSGGIFAFEMSSMRGRGRSRVPERSSGAGVPGGSEAGERAADM